MFCSIDLLNMAVMTAALFFPMTACSDTKETEHGAATDGAGTETPVPDQEPDPGKYSRIAWEVAERLAPGWNLGNQMDAHADGTASETCWGNPAATQATFDGVKAAGFRSVRIPVTWLGHIGPAPDYDIDPEWLDRVAELVGYAGNAGLNVIINMHHDGAESGYWLNIKEAALDPERDRQIKEQISAMWTQIARKFKDKGDFLIFEAFNEIHDGGWGWGANMTDGGKQYCCLNGWNQTFVDAVRAAGGENARRYLAVPGYCTNPDLTIKYFEMPEDKTADRIIVSVHYYDPNEYTLTAKYSEWGHTARTGECAGHDEEEHVKDVFSALHEKFISKGIPVYIGETGCVNRETEREQAFQRYWFEYVFKAAKTYGMAAFVWDNGAEGTGNERHAFIDHATGEFCSEPARMAVEIMVRAMTSETAGYTLDSIYENAPFSE